MSSFVIPQGVPYNEILAEKPRSSLRDWLEYAAVRILLDILAFLPWHAASSLAASLFRILDRFVPKLRRVGRRNLELALPEASAARREEILDGVFAQLGRTVATVARMPAMHAGNIGRYIRYEGFAHFERSREKGRGVLFFTAHLGNWELSAFAHALMSAPMHIVVRPLDNPRLDEFVGARRTGSGNQIIRKKDYIRGILKALHQNQAVGILADQNTGLDEGIFIDFFGKPACTHPGVAKLAAHSGAAVIPGFALWSETERRYILRFYEPIAMSGDVQQDTQNLHRHLEQVIREHPDQWLWIHRRWKTRPPGEPPLY